MCVLAALQLALGVCAFPRVAYAEGTAAVGDSAPAGSGDGAHGDPDMDQAPPGPAEASPSSTQLMRGLEQAAKPPTNVVYLQYGVALGAEIVSSAGAMCGNTAVPCVLGTGGGVTVRAGWRSSGSVYLGGAYSFSKQDPNQLLRLAILQQARAEGRYYFQTARDVEPYALIGLGIAGYGNEWRVATYGPALSMGVGLELQVTRRTVIGVATCYRLIVLKSFTDSSGAFRDSGTAQFIGLDLVLEQRDPIFTNDDASTVARSDR